MTKTNIIRIVSAILMIAIVVVAGITITKMQRTPEKQKPSTTQSTVKKTEEKAKTGKEDASDKEKTEDAEQADNEDQKSNDGETKQEAKQASNTGANGNAGSSPNNNQPSNSAPPAEATTAKAENNYLTRDEMIALANEIVAYTNNYATSRGLVIDNSLTAADGESTVNGVDYDPAYNTNLKAKTTETVDFLINVVGIKRLKTVWYWDSNNLMIVIDYYYNW